MKKVLGVTGVDFNSSELFILYRYRWCVCTTVLRTLHTCITVV